MKHKSAWLALPGLLEPRAGGRPDRDRRAATGCAAQAPAWGATTSWSAAKSRAGWTLCTCSICVIERCTPSTSRRHARSQVRHFRDLERDFADRHECPMNTPAMLSTRERSRSHPERPPLRAVRRFLLVTQTPRAGWNERPRRRHTMCTQQISANSEPWPSSTAATKQMIHIPIRITTTAAEILQHVPLAQMPPAAAWHCGWPGRPK